MAGLIGAMLMLQGCLADRSPFQSRSELRAAVIAWLTDEDRMAAKYGPIADWDVSLVTDMSGLFQGIWAWQDYGYGYIQNHFNESIGSWDTSAVTDMSFMFASAERFNQPLGSWNTSRVTNMSHMFAGARSFNQSIVSWDTSAVRDMRSMFSWTEKFNQPIGAWNTTSVRDMSSMFAWASAFNRPIGLWDTSAVTDMRSMFSAAKIFNQPIGSWNTGAVRDMSRMFCWAGRFNQSIESWNTSAVTDMSRMFEDADAFFNQPIGAWNTSRVTNMSRMFFGAWYFNQSIGSWNTGAVRDMSGMFRRTGKFNQPIGSWNTTAVQDMQSMFERAVVFNQPIGSWNTGKVRNMSRMFLRAAVFNQPIGSWNTAGVTDMRYMFYESVFNQPIGSWNTAGVTNMKNMFNRAVFDQPIGSWNTAAVTDMRYMFYKAVFNQPIGSWNTGAVRYMNGMFYEAVDFNQPIGSWNTTGVTDMRHMFYKAAAFNQPIGSWSTGAVTNTSSMFFGAAVFNQPIGSWNTAAVRGMAFMFGRTGAFNEPIGSWNTAGVTDMRYMFYNAVAFNQPIGSWNTCAVRDMQYMFHGAVDFNQPIGSWNTSAVEDMSYIFYNATAFDQSIGLWELSAGVRTYQMSPALSPPCQPGRGPGANGLLCQRCDKGKFALAGTSCQECPAGSAPSEDRSTCDECPALHYSFRGMDECVACDLPLILVDNNCVWWHLPLLAVGFAALVVIFGFVRSCLRSRRARKVERIMEELYQDLWDEKPSAVAAYSQKLRHLGINKSRMEDQISTMRALQSHRAGVSLGYLLSAQFTKLAAERTGKEDPSFMDMKTAFWLAEEPLGQEIICPRDGRAGCALVDWIPRDARREQTHFMSWTWRYTLRQVQSALQMFSTAGPTSTDVFFFMCFFVNNQFRIIVEESSTGSDNLEDVFESNLRRIGRMVAIVDSWDQPVYLSRVWTVYEQFVASTIKIQVQFVMPKVATDELQHQIGCGNEGIDRVIKSLRQVDSRQARAWNLADEIKVKAMIEDTVGFDHVDAHVTDVMITWIGNVMEQTCKQLLKKARANEPLHEPKAISDDLENQHIFGCI